MCAHLAVDPEKSPRAQLGGPCLWSMARPGCRVWPSSLSGVDRPLHLDGLARPWAANPVNISEQSGVELYAEESGFGGVWVWGLPKDCVGGQHSVKRQGGRKWVLGLWHQEHIAWLCIYRFGTMSLTPQILYYQNLLEFFWLPRGVFILTSLFVLLFSLSLSMK